jgi:hypothetical protein
MRPRSLLLCSAVVIATLACNLGGGGTAAPSEDALFEDDFSDTGSGWSTLTDEDGVTEYAGGGYRFFIDAPDKFFWESPLQSSSGDVVVQAEATKVAGPDDADIGVICRYDSANQIFYFLTYGPHGYASIGYWDGDGYEVLAESDGNDFGDTAGPHTVRGDCVGDTLTLYVDRQEVLSTTDTSLTSGDAGLIVGSYDEPGVDVIFDNFQVLEP